MFQFASKGAAVIALAATISACGDDTIADVPEPNIIDVATNAGTFSTLLTALELTGLTSTFEGTEEFTVFAPSDAAFEALPAGALDALLADLDLLARVLTYHVVSGRTTAAEVVGLTSAPTLNGKDVAISVENGEVFIDGAKVVSTDIEARNGVIHVIDDVLLPEVVLDLIQTAEKAGTFATLLRALDAADLTGVLKGTDAFTVFAPTDAAFAALPAGTLDALIADPETLSAILLYHVVPGRVTSTQVVGLTEAVTVNGAAVAISVDGTTVLIDEATVTAVDIEATNGIIHIIDQVILPPM
jgi:uncharacterized surface protein with fasciclin (FAS1) repeats